MMEVSHGEVRRIASLARLVVEESRIPALADELSGILRHMAVLRQAVDEGTAPPMAGSGGSPVSWRPDVTERFPFALPPEGFAPAMRDGFFLVPRLSTQDASAESAPSPGQA